MKRRGFLQQLFGGVVGGAVIATAKPEPEPIVVTVKLDGKALAKDVMDVIDVTHLGSPGYTQNYIDQITFNKRGAADKLRRALK